MIFRTLLLAGLVQGVAPREAGAADVTVQVHGVDGRGGVVRVAVCPRDQFLKPTCAYVAHAPALAGTTTVTVTGVPPGEYAVQAHHDAQNTGRIRRNLFGIPTDGIGFSRDAPMRFGPPRFPDAAVLVGDALVTLDITLRFEP